MNIIIVGGDNTAYFLAKRFLARKYHVTMINREMQRCEELAQQTDALVVHGDGSDPDILEEAGARKADVLLAITPQDQDNLIACQVASREFGVPRVISIVNDPDNEEVFRKLGVDITFSATRIIGSVLDEETSFEDVISLMPLANGRLSVKEINLPKDAPAVGKTLSDLELSSETLVASVLRGDDVIVPRGDTELQAGDHLLVVSQPAKSDEDMVILLGEKH